MQLNLINMWIEFLDLIEFTTQTHRPPFSSVVSLALSVQLWQIVATTRLLQTKWGFQLFVMHRSLLQEAL